MKVRTLNRFREKDNYNVVHEVGSVFECDNERGNYLCGLGFVEKLKDEQKVEKPAEAPKAEAKKEGKKKVKPFVDETEENGDSK